MPGGRHHWRIHGSQAGAGVPDYLQQSGLSIDPSDHGYLDPVCHRYGIVWNFKYGRKTGAEISTRFRQ